MFESSLQQDDGAGKRFFKRLAVGAGAGFFAWGATYFGIDALNNFDITALSDAAQKTTSYLAAGLGGAGGFGLSYRN